MNTAEHQFVGPLLHDRASLELCCRRGEMLMIQNKRVNWESIGIPGATTKDKEQLERIDLRWHDLRHEGACRLLADGVDVRIFS